MTRTRAERVARRGRNDVSTKPPERRGRRTVSTAARASCLGVSMPVGPICRLDAPRHHQHAGSMPKQQQQPLRRRPQKTAEMWASRSDLRLLVVILRRRLLEPRHVVRHRLAEQLWLYLWRVPQHAERRE